MVIIKKRILITYASYGSGHKTVANYIYHYFSKHSNYDIKIIDLMDYENVLGLVSKKVYEQNFKRRTSGIIFSLIYEIFDFKTTTFPYKSITKSIFKNKELREDIINFNPDLLVSTHFFGNIFLGMLNKKKLTNCKIISIITDYKSHEMWVKDEKHIDALIVSNDIVKNDLVNEYKIDSKKVYSFGIPLAEEFSYQDDDIIKIKRKYQVDNGKKTILFFAGGSVGSSFSYKYFKKLTSREYNINIIYVCGKNNKLREKASKYVLKNEYNNVVVLGFSNEVNNLLSIANMVVTKPGGISITECLEMKKPMLLIPGNGGNENYNAKFVFKNGYGLICNRPRKLVKTVGKLLKKKHLLINMKNKLNNYNDNKSVEKIYDLAVRMLDD